MKQTITLAILVIAFALFGAFETSAQQNKPRAKDLYTQYNDNNPATTGNEGAKVSILLKRGNQAEKLVSPNETFYSGDKIKLVLDINFSGYAAIINVGPTGNESILFPYIEGGRMIDHSISPNAALKLPRGNAWINFDNTVGKEQITVIFSKNPIAETDRYEEAVTPGSDGEVVSESEADAILAELNSKSLATRKSKDLYTQTDNDGTYIVSPTELGNEPVAFTFYLKHQ